MTCHIIERTSPKGPGCKFIGRCILCDKTDLPASAARLECPRGLSADEGVIVAINGDWQPIDTAPRDGTKIEVKAGEQIFRPTYWTLCCDPEPHGSYGWAFTPRHVYPTHWRPL